jgi:hypothetical protein
VERIPINEKFEDGFDIEINDFDEIYSDREYDFCEAELSVMAGYAGLHRNSITPSLIDLERNFLIEPLSGYNGWKVFLKSKDSTSGKENI